MPNKYFIVYGLLIRARMYMPSPVHVARFICDNNRAIVFSSILGSSVAALFKQVIEVSDC